MFADGWGAGRGGVFSGVPGVLYGVHSRQLLRFFRSRSMPSIVTLLGNSLPQVLQSILISPITFLGCLGWGATDIILHPMGCSQLYCDIDIVLISTDGVRCGAENFAKNTP